MTEIRRVHAGFTLIEVLVVLAILAALAGIGSYALITYRNMAARSTTTSNLKLLKTSIDQFEINTGRYPERLRDLVANKNLDDETKKRWQGPYVEAVPMDGWKHEFKYKITPGEKRPYQLYSFGAGGSGAPKEEWLSVWDI